MELNMVDKFPFKVSVNGHEYDNAIAWCRHHVGLEYVDWKVTHESARPSSWKCVCHFKSESDATQFAMTWS